MLVLKGLGEMYDGATNVVNGLNPFVTTIESGRNKELLKTLIASGVSKEDIMTLVDINRTDAEEFITIESEVQKRLQEAKATKPKTSKGS